MDLLTKQIRAIVSRHGPVRHLEISRTNVDVLYSGHSLLHSHILAMRDLIRSDVPPWDFIIKLSAADYPIKSVEFIERLLAAKGVLTWTESFCKCQHMLWGVSCMGGS